MSRIVEFRSSSEDQIVHRVIGRIRSEIDQTLPLGSNDPNQGDLQFSDNEPTALTGHGQKIQYEPESPVLPQKVQTFDSSQTKLDVEKSPRVLLSLILIILALIALSTLFISKG